MNMPNPISELFGDSTDEMKYLFNKKVKKNIPIKGFQNPLNSETVVCIVCTLDILFSSNHNIHKSSCVLCFWASDPLIERF